MGVDDHVSLYTCYKFTKNKKYVIKSPEMFFNAEQNNNERRAFPYTTHTHTLHSVVAEYREMNGSRFSEQSL